MDLASKGTSARSRAVSRERGEHRADGRSETSLEASRRADTDQAMHEEAQIETATVHQHALQDVGMPPQMHAAQRTRLVEMGKRAFH